VSKVFIFVESAKEVPWKEWFFCLNVFEILNLNHLHAGQVCLKTLFFQKMERALFFTGLGLDNVPTLSVRSLRSCDRSARAITAFVQVAKIAVVISRSHMVFPFQVFPS
jgi:hypothetical protein